MATTSYPMDRYMKEAFEATLKQPVPLLVGGLLGLLAVAFSLGILTMPVSAGLGRMYLKVRRGQKVDPMDVFGSLDKFVPLLLAGLAIFLYALALPLVAILVATLMKSYALMATAVIFAGCYALAVGAWYMHVPELIADRNMAVGDALRLSKETVQAKGGAFNHLLLLLVMGVINAIGSSFAVGVLFTFPWTLGVMAYAYDDEVNTGHAVATCTARAELEDEATREAMAELEAELKGGEPTYRKPVAPDEEPPPRLRWEERPPDTRYEHDRDR